ncbi:MAG: GHMP kinase, partial [Bacteroidetes bacterium]|nr:GHMP kinase [Bacteroidota bacterium]
MIKNYYSNGKLLITGEYLVLDGALSLAVPTQFGQSLSIEHINENKLIWKSVNNKGDIWFEDEYIIGEIASVASTPRNAVSNRLLQILFAAKKLNPHFLSSNIGYKVITKLDFPQFWGLGSSSTLIHNIAQWAKVDAYQLLEQTFGGSGYDIACAQHNLPITYQLLNKDSEILRSSQNDKKRMINEVNFNPIFSEHLFFVHLNKKQNSREGIAQYHSNKNNSVVTVSEISDITSKVITCTSLDDFEYLITSHEHIISKIIKQEPIKELLFNDYKGAIKSLGAWGGDFILAT